MDLNQVLGQNDANSADVTVADQSLHGQEQCAFGDAVYRGVEKRPGKRCALPDTLLGRIPEKIEYYKASLQADDLGLNTVELCLE